MDNDYTNLLRTIDDSKMLRGLNIDGCRRRRGQAGRGRPQFRCDGNIGPPCTVKRGDTVYLDVDFSSGIVVFNRLDASRIFSRNHMVGLVSPSRQ